MECTQCLVESCTCFGSHSRGPRSLRSSFELMLWDLGIWFCGLPETLPASHRHSAQIPFTRRPSEKACQQVDSNIELTRNPSGLNPTARRKKIPAKLTANSIKLPMHSAAAAYLCHY
eukprot:523865-Amphidinium_carterae.1